jgi:hypothetical protein
MERALEICSSEFCFRVLHVVGLARHKGAGFDRDRQT